MQAQEIFDKVITHLRKQGVRSTKMKPATPERNSYLACSYRGENGLMCAIGCLIPDDVYKTCFEGSSISGLFGWLDTKSDFYQLLWNNRALLQSLQSCHDGTTPALWESMFKDIAAHYHLKFTPASR